ncbi:hypothetical protein E0H75_28855 [Kribbella capetownensis]|uniref:Uncharacterized protein n=1 Tax=Kribbella capetownensis TaxID=1572659 RepID=A0A4R0JHP3_9ACTN|nr:hypothetical protein [Kribbella capetownensis]TCC45737.1 hypothetical protein E0H75_28855 [Kribbella capetownensis]
MTSDDLRHLFKTVAAEGSDKVRLDEHRLLPRIRQRRRRRMAVTGLSGLVSAAVIAVGAYAVLPGGSGQAPVAGSPSPSPLPTKPTAAVGDGPKCGGKIDASFPLGRSSGREGLVLPDQTIPKSADGWGGELRLEVGDPRQVDRIDAWIGAKSTFVVTRNHVVIGDATVTVEKPVTSQALTASISLRHCGATVPAAGRVDLYGQLFPGQHPITFLSLQLSD